MTAGTGATPTHAPGLGAVVVDSGLTLADVDNANLTGATVTLTNRPDGTAEALALTGSARTVAETAGITVGSYDAGTGTLTLSGTATKAAYQAALRAVTYDNSLAIPSNAARSVIFTVRDPSGYTATQDASTVSRSIAFNTTPGVSANTGMTVAEGASAQTITSAMLAATDAEQTPSGLIYTVTTLTRNGTLRLNGNALALNSTFTQGDVDAGRISYSHDGSETLSDSFGFSVADGTTTLTGRTFAIIVTPVNDLPVISGVSTTPADITDKRTAKPFTDATLTDSDLPGQSITVQVSIAVGRGSLAGNGSHAGSFNAATGIWSFTGTTAEADGGAARPCLHPDRKPGAARHRGHGRPDAVRLRRHRDGVQRQCRGQRAVGQRRALRQPWHQPDDRHPGHGVQPDRPGQRVRRRRRRRPADHHRHPAPTAIRCRHG